MPFRFPHGPNDEGCRRVDARQGNMKDTGRQAGDGEGQAKQGDDETGNKTVEEDLDHGWRGSGGTEWKRASVQAR